MIIFINDIPVKVHKPHSQPEPGQFNEAVDMAVESLTQARLINHVWLKNVTVDHLDEILGFLNSRVPINLLSLDITVLNYTQFKTFLKNRYVVVKAAGGLIRKKGKYLMIYRLKKWDLPKGKKEKRESRLKTAVREVEEECNMEVKISHKICTTWHTYTMNKSNMLKQTRWFAMEVLDDSRMKPLREEDIEELRWMNAKEVYHALEHSYKSISYVFDCYFKSIEVQSHD